ncbi:MAG: selenide, water dikinase SelD [Luteimonas sp.]
MSDTPGGEVPRLTSLSHGGGCGCKIAPGVLADLLRRAAPAPVWPQLMVGNDTADDAAVYRLNDEQVLIATTDFFMPIVDDPYDFGRIAATNALSDVYAMGGSPVMALAIVGMPINVLPHAVIADILRGGEDACAEAGIPVAGGHSIDSVEPIYGLAAMGIAHPDRIRRNADARPGDLLVLGKPLGVGVLSAALKRGVLDDAGYTAMIDATTRLNRVGVPLATLPDVHAMTDVTGFGLLGHALELARGAGLAVRLRFDDLPWLPGVQALAADGVVTGASGRNWTAYGEGVELGAGIDQVKRDLLTDPQTSGGLLVSCAPQALGEVLDAFQREGFADAAVIGETRAGEARVEVT